MPLSRREFLGCVTTGAVSWYLSRLDWLGPSAWAESPGGFFDAAGPIDRSLNEKAPEHFFGDSFERAHRTLWDLPAFFQSHSQPKEWETTDLAIVGGGLSGLFTAFAMRDRNPIVLEQGSRFGGNAIGQSWRGVEFGLGSAYFTQPEPGSAMHRFCRETGLDKMVQTPGKDESVSIDGKIARGFWDGAAEPQHAAIYAKLAKYLRGVQKTFPDIPPTNDAQLQVLRELDQKSLAQCLRDNVGELPPLLSRAIESYCWSSLAASSSEVSAATGLGFLAFETAPLCVAPGGNAGVAEQLIRASFKSGVPSRNFRADSLVVRVTAKDDGVEVLYIDGKQALRGIRARAAVMACPKFVAGRIVENLDASRLAAFKSLEYRSYVTAGVLISKPLRTRFYDLFLTASQDTGRPTRATDAVVGSLGQTRGRNTVLTLYRPFVADQARAVLSSGGAYASLKKEFVSQIEGELLPALGFRKSDVADIRLARFGHAIPLAKPGMFLAGTPAVLRRPFQGRVFFVEQDNWMTPALETAAGEAALQEPMIRAVLGAKDLARKSK